MLRHALEGHGHAVLEARDETEAVQQLGQSRPVVVLTDLKLPVGDGFGVLRAAKELDPDLPVVVMTAYGSIQDAVTAMREGALDFLAKPIDPDHLLLMVERAIAQRRMVAEFVEQGPRVAVDAELADPEPGGDQNLGGVGDGVEDVVLGPGLGVVGGENRPVVEDENGGWRHGAAPSRRVGRASAAGHSDSIGSGRPIRESFLEI